MTPAELETIVVTRLETLYRVARRMVSGKGSAEAEDLVGETLVIAFRECQRCDGRFPFAWLIQIMRRRAMKQHAKAHPEERLDDLLVEPMDALAHQDLLARIQNIDVLQALDRLPLEYRMVVALCDMEEMDYAEAATALGIPIGTVRSRLNRGRKLLQRSLIAYGTADNSDI